MSSEGYIGPGSEDPELAGPEKAVEEAQVNDWIWISGAFAVAASGGLNRKVQMVEENISSFAKSTEALGFQGSSLLLPGPAAYSLSGFVEFDDVLTGDFFRFSVLASGVTGGSWYLGGYQVLSETWQMPINGHFYVPVDGVTVDLYAERNTGWDGVAPLNLDIFIVRGLETPNVITSQGS